MGVDTVKLRSPSIDEGTASFLERQLVEKTGVDRATGEVLYCYTTGSLSGSWDSRIAFNVHRKDWVYDEIRGLRQEECPPYVEVECSVHKLLYGHNVYGNPCNVPELCRLLVNFLGEDLGSDHGMFTSADRWQVRRIDWAEMFSLSFAAQLEFIRQLKSAPFPRRAMKEAKYATAVHFPGSHTTLRIYMKGPEFKEHTYSSLLSAMVWRESKKTDGQRPSPGLTGSSIPVKLVRVDNRYRHIYRKCEALQRLANNRLRAEIQINADKLRSDWGGRFPLVSEMSDTYCQKVYQHEMFKLLREGKSEMETVRTNDEVIARLSNQYGSKTANALYAFWMQMTSRGESQTRLQYSKSQFFTNRKKLVDAGISWLSTNVHVLHQDLALPRGFKPLAGDPRRCVGGVSPRSFFAVCPVEYAQLKRAA